MTMELGTSAHEERKEEERKMSSWDCNEDFYRPCLILGHSDLAYAASARRGLRQLGWDVYLASTGPEARRLAKMLNPEIVVLDTDLAEESGWLTCEKLVRDEIPLKVFLVSKTVNPVSEEFRQFVGAAGLISYHEGVEGLVDQVCGDVLTVCDR
jgi:CheY-like chemotaxis protein